MHPGESRHRRVYASSIVRRKSDWLVIADVDSGAHYDWGQVALTAKDPVGPWSAPVLIAALDGSGYYPSPVEAFPAFVHDGYVYDPRTSVGMNRNFQVIMRAPIESAHLPEAWRMYQHGSAWHAGLTSREYFGIWGQTFAGSVSPDGRLNALFPSRREGDGAGVISMASRPWNHPMRDRGFAFSAHGASAVTVLRAAYAEFELTAELTVRGAGMRLAWDYHAPLGATGRADGKPDEVVRTRQRFLEWKSGFWRIAETGENREF